MNFVESSCNYLMEKFIDMIFWIVLIFINHLFFLVLLSLIGVHHVIGCHLLQLEIYILGLYQMNKLLIKVFH